MKLKINTYTFFLKLSIFIIVLSESNFSIKYNINDVLEYLGYFILLLCILKNFIKYEKDKIKVTFSFIVFLFLTSIGFLIQDLTIKRKIILTFTTLAIAAVTCLSQKTIRSEKTARDLAYTILYTIFCSSILAVCTGIGIIDSVDSSSGGFLPISFGLNFGIKYKNYFAADMIAVFIGIFNYYKNYNKSQRDKVFLNLISIMIILSNSKGGILLFLIVLIVSKIDIFKNMSKTRKKIIISMVSVAGLLFSIYIYNNIILNVSTYAYRYRGLTNFLDYFSNDKYHLFNGISELVYDQNLNYVMKVRSITGFDGSLEMAWLNILIKSGIIGLIGYAILFYKFIHSAIKENDFKHKTKLIIILSVLLYSSLVEAYIQSMHCIFAIYLYLIINVKESDFKNYEKV